jgi:SAM-dependent methyltransferase
MASWGERLERRLAPPRRRGTEILDSPDIDPAVRSRAHRDIDLSNAWLGGARAMAAAISDAFRELAGTATILDAGSGSGRTLGLAHRIARGRGIGLTSIALDLDPGLARDSAGAERLGVCGSVLALPFDDRSIDVVVCSLLLHHFEGEALCQAIRELNRVARTRVIVHDLRRSRIAAAGIWALSFPLGFHPISRHDGVASVLRGFTRADLRSLVYDSAGAHPRVSRHLGYRLVGAWAPGPGAAGR